MSEEYHNCHFCGEYVKDGKEYNGTKHWLSDCRPDLVEHEIGELCTWPYRREALTKSNGEVLPPLPENETCYAYRSDDRGTWTNEHTHFYEDGPM
jgi:hypothetical protein